MHSRGSALLKCLLLLVANFAKVTLLLLLMPILPLTRERFLNIFLFFSFFGDAMQSERKHISRDIVMISESF